MASQERDTLYTYYNNVTAPINSSPVVINLDNVYFTCTLVSHGSAISGSGVFVEINYNNFTPKLDNISFKSSVITQLTSDRSYNGVTYTHNDSDVYVSSINNLNVNSGKPLQQDVSYTFSSGLVPADNNYLTIMIEAGYSFNQYRDNYSTILDEEYEAGYSAGYTAGYSRGQTDNSQFDGVFTMLGSAFDSAGGLLQTTIIGGISIGTFIMIPLGATILISLFKILRK